MIVYNQAYDFYHAIYRIIRLLTRFKRDAHIELDRVRIWDFYMLFPDEVHEIRLKQGENEIRDLRRRFVKKKENPYKLLTDKKIIFEKLRPYQMTALQCLASYGIISKEELKHDRVTVVSEQLLTDYNARFEELTYTEQNVIALMTLYFFTMSLYGSDGFKARTDLMISKYDA